MTIGLLDECWAYIGPRLRSSRGVTSSFPTVEGLRVKKQFSHKRDQIVSDFFIVKRSLYGVINLRIRFILKY